MQTKAQKTFDDHEDDYILASRHNIWDNLVKKWEKWRLQWKWLQQADNIFVLVKHKFVSLSYGTELNRPQSVLTLSKFTEPTGSIGT